MALRSTESGVCFKMEDHFTFPGARLVEYPDSFPPKRLVFSVPELFSPTAKFFDVDGLPVVWDIEGSPPTPMIATRAGALIQMMDGGRLLKDGVVIDETRFREMLTALPTTV
jgi:hypothetical protein